MVVLNLEGRRTTYIQKYNIPDVLTVHIESDEKSARRNARQRQDDSDDSVTAEGQGRQAGEASGVTGRPPPTIGTSFTGVRTRA